MKLLFLLSTYVLSLDNSELYANMVRDYFTKYSLKQLHFQEAIEIFTRFFSERSAEEIHEVQEKLMNSLEITEEEKSILILKHFTREFFLQHKNEKFTEEFLVNIISEYYQFVNEKIDQFYKE